MNSSYPRRLAKVAEHMRHLGIDVLLLAKPSNRGWLQRGYLPLGYAFFQGEKAPPPLPENVVIPVGNCGLYAGP